MNVTRFNAMLSEALWDFSNATFGASDIQLGMSRAVREYSRYRPQLRRFGIATLYTAVSAAATTLNVAGGIWSVGQQFVLDAFGSQPENCTVSAVSAGPTDELDSTAVTLTVGALSYNHPAGALLTPGTIAAAGTYGLALVVNQATYTLPLDWIQVDQESFDLAVGARATVVRTGSYYDSVYSDSDAFAGTGYGLNQGYTLGYPFSGNPQDNPNGVPSPVDSAVVTGQTYRFTTSSPGLLTISPPPFQTLTLDFNYWASHTPETVPDDQMDALVAYGAYALLSAFAAKRAIGLSGSEKDATRNPHLNVKALTDLAAEHKKNWERQVVRRPYMVSG